MGGLRRRMPKTFITFAVATLALMGCPPFAGFFSKDAILLAAASTNRWIFLLGLATAFLTAFYMTRLFVVAFLGRARSHAAEHGHDGPAAMTVPLLILGIMSVIAGWGIVSGPIFGHPFMEKLHAAAHEPGIAKMVTMVPLLATAVFVIGVVIGWVLYAKAEKDPISIPMFRRKFYFDEIYAALIAGTQDLIAKVCALFDKWVIDGLLVRGAAGAAWATGFALRLFNFGNLQGYAFFFGTGVVALIWYMVFLK